MRTHRQMTRALRELSELAPAPESTERAMSAAQAAIREAFAEQQSKPAIKGLRFPRTAVAAAIASVVLAIGLLAIAPSTPTIAFSQVVSQVENVKSVTYTRTRSDIARAGEPRGPVEVVKVTILGRSRMREEWISVTPGEPLTDGAEWYADPSDQGLVMISNLTRGRIVTLRPKAKEFAVVQGFVDLTAEGGKPLQPKKVTPAPEVDFYKDVRQFPVDKAERLTGRQINGHSVIGFRTVEKTQRREGTDTWTRTYWVDAKSKLPVQIDVSFESTDKNMGQSHWVQSDIEFDQPVDEALLSTEPPAGYMVVK